MVTLSDYFLFVSLFDLLKLCFAESLLDSFSARGPNVSSFCKEPSLSALATWLSENHNRPEASSTPLICLVSIGEPGTDQKTPFD
ncbi:unnamed protein product [Cochlearia groenlandica]